MNQRDFVFSKSIVVPHLKSPHLTLGHWDIRTPCLVLWAVILKLWSKEGGGGTLPGVTGFPCPDVAILAACGDGREQLQGWGEWRAGSKSAVTAMAEAALSTLMWTPLPHYCGCGCSDTLSENTSLPPHSLTHSSIFQHNTPTLPPHSLYLRHIPQSIHSLAHPELNPKTPPNPHTYTKASKASPRIKHRTSQIGATSQTSEQQQR
jgi:hypothetical protein